MTDSEPNRMVSPRGVCGIPPQRGEATSWDREATSWDRRADDRIVAMELANRGNVEFNANGEAVGRWWTEEGDGRILCQLCPRACRMKPGDRGFCFVRTNRDGRMVLDTYGRSTGFCIDPIEKKPLNHFLPGTPVLSFGTAGCNLGCKFCQNWDISKSREVARLSDNATPDDDCPSGTTDRAAAASPSPTTTR